MAIELSAKSPLRFQYAWFVMLIGVCVSCSDVVASQTIIILFSELMRYQEVTCTAPGNSCSMFGLVRVNLTPLKPVASSHPLSAGTLVKSDKLLF